MITKQNLYEEIQRKKSFLCVGLDSDLAKIPEHLLDAEDPIFEFNKRIIDATKEFAVAYKPNTAFYEANGANGWKTLEKTLNYIPKNIFTIADAKRADIGNTSHQYAKAFFENLNFDSVTIAPYMGSDSVKPFLDYSGKWVIILAATSNPGGKDFQDLPIAGTEKKLFEQVLSTSAQWGSSENTMYVVGATRPETLKVVREIVPDHFLLIPGVGAQGGSLEEVCEFGLTDQCGLLINSSRGILYSDSTHQFAEAARESAESLQRQMAELLQNS